MKKVNKLIRKGVFETNSSSAHTLIVNKEAPKVYDTLEVNEQGNVVINCYRYDFGRTDAQYLTSAVDKIAFYVAVFSELSDVQWMVDTCGFDIYDLIDVIKKNTSCNKVYFEQVGRTYLEMPEYGYILPKKEELYDVIFDLNTVLVIRSDEVSDDDVRWDLAYKKFVVTLNNNKK